MFEAVVALVALVALVAVVAFPLNAAVIVPAEKFPDASLITIVLTVFAVAVLIHVGMEVPPLASSCPAVPAAVIPVVPAAD